VAKLLSLAALDSERSNLFWFDVLGRFENRFGNGLAVDIKLIFPQQC